MPLQVGGDQAAAFPADRRLGRVGDPPAAHPSPATLGLMSALTEGDWLGWAAPGGRQSGQTAPPAGTENAACRPGVPQTAHSASAGAQPAVAMARSR